MRRYGSEDNERWRGFEHRPDDIVISTRSKCGTTLAQMMCALVVFQDPDLPAPLSEISPWLDWSVEPAEVVRARLDAQQHRRIIKTHTPLDGLPLEPDVTYVVVGRHPLDVAVSLYHHAANIDRNRFAELSGAAPARGRTAPLADWIRAWMDPTTPVSSQLDTLPGLIHHVTDAWQRSHQPNVVLVHYRDLTTDTEGQLRSLATRLGIEVSEDRLPLLAKAATFDAMKDLAAWLAPFRLGVLKDPDSFFRSGRSGEGERVLDDDGRQRYETLITELTSSEIRQWLHHGSAERVSPDRDRGAVNERQLQGGIANSGSVVRTGSHVLRPSSRSSPSVHAFLQAVREAGFDGVPMPVGIDDDGRERLEFIAGDVPTAPYPDWSRSDTALASVAKLLRRLHDAARTFDPDGLVWNDALADPMGGTIVCHNDVELSNVVFRGGVACALIDFEFAAPGRPVYDLAHLARLCVPIEHDFDQTRMGWQPADRPARLRLVADAYGLGRDGRVELLAAIDDAIDRIEEAVRNPLARDPNAAETLERTGGIDKYARRRTWWSRHYDAFAAALR